MRQGEQKGLRINLNERRGYFMRKVKVKKEAKELKKGFFFTMALVLVLVAPGLSVFANDLSFEQGLDSWTVEQRQDSWPGTLHEFTSDVIDERFSDGAKSVRLGAKIVGDSSYWWQKDESQIIVWAGPFNLMHGISISVDMTGIQRSEPQFSWGWGMEADLILSDGINETRSLLWDYHEEPYGPKGLEDNLYSLMIIGEDGTQWYRYTKPLTAANWYGTDFGGGPLSDLDLSAVYIGIVFAAINWHSSPQTLWANGLVDNLQIEYETLPVEINVDPDTLNMKSAGKENSITVYTDLPYDQVDIDSLTLNGLAITFAVADEDGNLKCKVDRQALIAIVEPPSATLTLKGFTTDGYSIVGSDTIRVIKPGK
jgi:hypothetical protein